MGEIKTHETRYSYKDAPTLKAFSKSDAFIRGLMGPLGGGKSSACVIEIIRRGLAQRPGKDRVRRTRWLVVRNTYKQLEDTTIKTFLQWLPANLYGKWTPSDHNYLITGFPGAEIEVLFRALDRPDHVRNVLSLELTGAWINEAREVPWAIVEALQGRVTRFPAKRDGGATWTGIFMDTNPPDVDSKWFKFFEETDHSEAVSEMAKFIPGMTLEKYYAIFKQPSGLGVEAENLSNLDTGYYQRLIGGKSEEWINVYLKGEYGFVVEGRPIYPEYYDSIHCKEVSTVSGSPVYRGFDFGLTPACVFAQMTPSGQFIVVDELVSDSMGIDRFSDIVLEHTAKEFHGRVFVDIGDPAGQQRAQTDEKTCYQILASKGIDIWPGKQDLTIRIESVRKPLSRLIARGQPGFLLHPRCKTLRKGFLGAYCYRRKQVSGEHYDPKPEKNMYSHCHDALQYIATEIFAEGLTTPYCASNNDDDNFLCAHASGRSEITGY